MYGRMIAGILKDECEKSLNGFIEIVCNREKIYLNTDCIVYIERVNRKIKVVCEKNSFLINESLNCIGERLPKHFIRCHIGYIVNKQYINYIGSKSITTSHGDEIALGRAYKNQVMEALKQVDDK